MKEREERERDLYPDRIERYTAAPGEEEEEQEVKREEWREKEVAEFRLAYTAPPLSLAWQLRKCTLPISTVPPLHSTYTPPPIKAEVVLMREGEVEVPFNVKDVFAPSVAWMGVVMEVETVEGVKKERDVNVQLSITQLPVSPSPPFNRMRQDE